MSLLDRRVVSSVYLEDDVVYTPRGTVLQTDQGLTRSGTPILSCWVRVRVTSTGDVQGYVGGMTRRFRCANTFTTATSS
jgi:hypothetical protein